jgi:hypothetical protein
LPTSLPAVSQVFGQSTTTTLGPNFDSNERRRYSGGMLQRARGAASRPEPLTSMPRASESGPASVGSPFSESDMSESARERAEQHDRCLENLRVIKTLREYVRGRLERREFNEEPSSSEGRRSPRGPPPEAMDVDAKSPAPQNKELPDASSLYPILRMPPEGIRLGARQ